MGLAGKAQTPDPKGRKPELRGARGVALSATDPTQPACSEVVRAGVENV